MPCHANRWLLDGVLRGEWGFDGAVVSDYGGIDELGHCTIVAARPGGGRAIRALTPASTADLPDGEAYRTLAEPVRAGRVPEAAIDTAVRRMLALKFRAGLFENPYADSRLRTR